MLKSYKTTDSDRKITRDGIIYCTAQYHMYTQGFFSCAANTVYRYLFNSVAVDCIIRYFNMSAFNKFICTHQTA